MPTAQPRHNHLRNTWRWALLVYTLLVQPVAHAQEHVRVQRALDGDSLILVDGRQVRLIGINTPEFGKNGAPHQPLAQNARDRLHALVGGRQVRLNYETEKSDRYGRLLAHVVLADGSDAETTLLREGLAWFVAIPPNTAHWQRYREAESAARHERRGIWGRTEYTPAPAERLNSSHTGFRVITGKVTAVKRRHDEIEIVLAPHVRLLLRPDTMDTTDITSWAGKQLIARGWLTGYNRSLRMRITHPSMMELP